MRIVDTVIDFLIKIDLKSSTVKMVKQRQILGLSALQG